VAAPERVAAVIKTRREWAEAAGLDGDVMEGLYRDLVAYSVSEEHNQWEADHVV
jgi:isochorismate pyruvate lyase